MPAIELIYDADCPNVPAARQALSEACKVLGLEPAWREWERSSPLAPAYALIYGSPTILVDGADVAGADTAGDAQSCRVYRNGAGRLQGTPEVETIVEVLRSGTPTGPNRGAGWLSAVGALFAGGGALLPALTCPACWPAYAGLLSAFGIGFVNYSLYLTPVLGGLLCLSVAGLVPGARRRHEWSTLLAGGVGAMLVLAGRFWLDHAWLTWVGVAILAAAALWDLLAERPGPVSAIIAVHNKQRIPRQEQACPSTPNTTSG